MLRTGSWSRITVGGDGDKDASIFRKSYIVPLYEAYSLVVLLYCFQQFFWITNQKTTCWNRFNLFTVISQLCDIFKFSNFQILKLSSSFPHFPNFVYPSQSSSRIVFITFRIIDRPKQKIPGYIYHRTIILMWTRTGFVSTMPLIFFISVPGLLRPPPCSSPQLFFRF